MKYPCLNCTDRKIGCHTYCDKYAKSKAEQDHINHVKRIAKVIDQYEYPKKVDNAIARAERR